MLTVNTDESATVSCWCLTEAAKLVSDN